MACELMFPSVTEYVTNAFDKKHKKKEAIKDSMLTLLNTFVNIISFVFLINF
jgi:hypothetical protein